jgi:NAD(P)-dependent dehydrogenase (short-subunit alcohol dehydrogenase family)
MPTTRCTIDGTLRSAAMEIRLDGKVALVTGASRGIGRATAEVLAAAGASVLVSSRKQDDLEVVAAAITAAGGTAEVFAANAGDPDQAAACVAATVERLGGIDILVNNAATNPYMGPAVDIDLARYDKTFQVNLRGPLVWTQAAVAHGLGGGAGGSVVNIASVGGMSIERGIGIYNTTKAALIHLTKVLASELGPAVRVNGVAPGLVKTDMARALWEANEDAIAKRMPAGRLGEPVDIANAVAFLASDAASWITGHTMVVDGGAMVAAR